MSEKNVLFEKGVKAARLSSFVILVLGIFKLVVALVTGSIALLADSFHSLSDVLTSAAVWFGLKIIQKKPTKRFPYGYYRAESFTLLIVSIVIIASGVFIIITAMEKLFEPIVLSYSSAVLLAAVISGAVSFALGRYKKRVGNLIGSQSLVSEGEHSIVDVYASLIVFVGVFFYDIDLPIGEVLAGLVIGALIVRLGFPYSRDAVLTLMDASTDPEAVEEMKEEAESVPGVEEVHHVRLRKSGPIYFGEIHIILQKGVSLERGHEISETIEERIKNRIRNVESITIHISPFHEEKHDEQSA